MILFRLCIKLHVYVYGRRIWAATGKPRMGKEFDFMRQVKRRYKVAIKTKESNSNEQFSDSLNDALLSKDMNSFFGIRGEQNSASL